MSKTGIEWTDRTWNPFLGCRKVSEGCRNCYAERLHETRRQAKLAGKRLPEQYARPFSEVQVPPGRVRAPLRWLKPSRIFVNSMGDFFYEPAVEEFPEVLVEAWKVMTKASWHTFQILTKRPETMLSFLEKLRRDHGLGGEPNIWLGVSVESQEHLDRIEPLKQAPAAIRFVSFEPLLGPLDGLVPALSGIDWVIVGGESGPGSRPMHPDWARSILERAAEAGVMRFFKQWGDWVPDELVARKNRPIFTFPDGRRVVRVGKRAAPGHFFGEVVHEWPGGAPSVTQRRRTLMLR
ncbi:phage Gp37/Gp68 family protein [Oceanithermus sp.]|uniref:DUF5131 family protein n=1 Tax=Oceanithermus sp. TaxID=2268145 RepID=UPI0025802CFC|nr:phage Gp37/Gp68 family protein [Oceanithermus sp.]